MRDAFHESLDLMTDQLVEMARLVGSAMSRATTALLDADLALAEGVIAGDEQIDAFQRELEERAIDLLARQQPVATDLRMVVTGLQMSQTLERMGDLARHVAQVARLRHPEAAVPASARSTIHAMGSEASDLIQAAGSIIARQDADAAAALDAADDEMDRLHREMFSILRTEGFEGNIEQAVDLTLLSRYYERFGDHAVALARRVRFLVTGEMAPLALAEEDREDVAEEIGTLEGRATAVSPQSAQTQG